MIENCKIDDKTRIVLDDFYNSIKLANQSQGTIRNYRYKLERFFKEIAIPVDKLTTDDVFKWLFDNVWSLKKTTIDNYISALSSFFRFCKEELYIDKVLIKRRWRPKIEKPLPKYLDASEVAKVKIYAESLPILNQLTMEFLLSSGCRSFEALGLNLSDIDVEKRIARVIGKGGKFREVHFSIPCSLIMKEYMHERNDNNPALFVNENGQRLKYKDLYHMIKSIGKNSGLSSNISPHCMRHTFATNLLSKGADLQFIGDELGHSDLNNTRIYARVPTSGIISEYIKRMGLI